MYSWWTSVVIGHWSLSHAHNCCLGKMPKKKHLDHFCCAVIISWNAVRAVRDSYQSSFNRTIPKATWKVKKICSEVIATVHGDNIFAEKIQKDFDQRSYSLKCGISTALGGEMRGKISTADFRNGGMLCKRSGQASFTCVQLHASLNLLLRHP